MFNIYYQNHMDDLCFTLNSLNIFQTALLAPKHSDSAEYMNWLFDQPFKLALKVYSTAQLLNKDGRSIVFEMLGSEFSHLDV